MWLSWSHHFKCFTVATIPWLTVTDICLTSDHWYVPLVVITAWFCTSSFMTYHLVCNKSNTTCATCVTETFSVSERMRWPQVLNEVRIARSIVFCGVFCRSLFVSFHLAKGLSVRLWFTASDYPIGIFEMFIQSTNEHVVIIILVYKTEYE
jgi:hypothetical protein